MDSESPKSPEEAKPTQPDTSSNTSPQISRRGLLAGVTASVVGLFGLDRLFKHIDSSVPKEVNLKSVPTISPTPNLEATATEKAKMDALNVQNAPTRTPIPLSTDKVQARETPQK